MLILSKRLCDRYICGIVLVGDIIAIVIDDVAGVKRASGVAVAVAASPVSSRSDNDGSWSERRRRLHISFARAF